MMQISSLVRFLNALSALTALLLVWLWRKFGRFNTEMDIVIGTYIMPALYNRMSILQLMQHAYGVLFCNNRSLSSFEFSQLLVVVPFFRTWCPDEASGADSYKDTNHPSR